MGHKAPFTKSENGSMGQMLRRRGNYLHISKELIVNPLQGPGESFLKVTPERGTAYNIGRNKAKRERRGNKR